MTFTLDQILTTAEIEQARELYRTMPTGFAKAVEEKLVKPNLKRIEKKLGQQMDSRYVAYAIEYVMRELNKTPNPPA